MVRLTDFQVPGDLDGRLKNALKRFEKTNEELESNIVQLKKWIRSQPHLPEIPRK